ncbi:inositol monophosphatase [Treponema sp. OMZ 840]|uniref:inositol monophosphatase family protein n=1 Tax=Treponema sp. OMZ 840 TaxID=244313 RepID=UPI003D91AEFB
MDKALFESLKAEVKNCGLFAKERQKDVKRHFKPDDSVVTETDLEISKKLTAKIRSLFPDCNIIDEEAKGLGFNQDAPYTFIFDPIDGTDSYSQGLPTWCIGVGILNKERQPVGSIVYAPNFGKCSEELFLWTEPDSTDVYVNGQKLVIAPEIMSAKDEPRQITTGSEILIQIDMSVVLPKIKAAPFNLKFKALGSSLLHIVSTVLFCSIDACVDPLCYVWDIAAAHAAIKKAGLDYQYYTGEEFVYDDFLLLKREKFPKPLVVGTEKGRKFLIAHLNP